MNLVVFYSNGKTRRVKVSDAESAARWVHAEGDHVVDWRIEEDKDDERLRKESG